MANTVGPLYQDAHAKIEAELSCDNRDHSKMVVRCGDADNSSSEERSYHGNCNPDFVSQYYGVSRRCNVPLDPPLLSSGDI